MKKLRVGDIVYWKSDMMPGKVTYSSEKHFSVHWSGLKNYKDNPKTIKWDLTDPYQWHIERYEYNQDTYFDSKVIKAIKTILIRRK